MSTEHDKVHDPIIPLFVALQVYWGWAILVGIGHLRDFFAKIFYPQSKPPTGYAPIVSDFEDFYTRRAYGRINDCWNRPIASHASTVIKVINREREYNVFGSYTDIVNDTKTLTNVINLGSYNYLGFGDAESPTNTDVINLFDTASISTCSARSDLGTTEIHHKAEKIVARYVGHEDAIIFGMGFGTNSTGLSCLAGPGTLIISDANNHASIVVGARSSGAKISVVKHNDIADYERAIRHAIINGQPKTHRPWKRILIVVEGIYSMEGEVCPLKEIVELKKKYKCHLYVDEAHSVGALGKKGGGICDHAGVDPKDVDILMGTFTKSFGAVGGYIAASKDIISYIRANSIGSRYSASISPPAVQQIISSMKMIMGEDGTNLGQEKLNSIRDNSNYFRDKLRDAGFHVLGDDGSPVVPVMLYVPSTIASFSNLCLKYGLAVVVVGFPATPLLLSRVRFCISAAHTKEQLDEALSKILEIGHLIGLRHDQQWI